MREWIELVFTEPHGLDPNDWIEYKGQICYVEGTTPTSVTLVCECAGD